MALKRCHRHPRGAFRDPATHAPEPVYSVHYNDYAERLQGAQAAYDVGIQRTCWQIHALTNWMGDAGFLKAATSQYRSHVYLSDVVRLGGRVLDLGHVFQGPYASFLMAMAGAEVIKIEPPRGDMSRKRGRDGDYPFRDPNGCKRGVVLNLKDATRQGTSVSTPLPPALAVRARMRTRSRST